MKLKDISIVTEIENVSNDWADVILTLDNGSSYSVVVTKPNYLDSQINSENLNFLRPESIFVFLGRMILIMQANHSMHF